VVEGHDALRHLKPHGLQSCGFGWAFELVKLVLHSDVGGTAHRPAAAAVATGAAKFGGCHQRISGLA